MKIVLGSRQEVVVQIFPCRWSPGKFLFHHRYQLAADFVDLIASKKIGNFPGGQKIVEVFKEALFFDFLVGEDKCYSQALHSCHSVKILEVFHQVGSVVRPMKCKIKTTSTEDYEELFFHNEYKSRTWLAYYLIRRLPGCFSHWLAD